MKRSGNMDLVSNRRMDFWCFSAHFGMKGIADVKPRSILLASGTLSPMDSFEQELGLPFPWQLENPHVINPKQVMVSILSQGLKKRSFDFSWKNNKDHEEMLWDLGHTLCQLSEKTPGGILLFFPSYRLMNNCYDLWQRTELAIKIDKNKMLLKEPKDPAEY